MGSKITGSSSSTMLLLPFKTRSQSSVAINHDQATGSRGGKTTLSLTTTKDMIRRARLFDEGVFIHGPCNRQAAITVKHHSEWGLSSREGADLGSIDSLSTRLAAVHLMSAKHHARREKQNLS
eukprot:scaffold85186_cov41-Cyclotella_meneghiniana.AAC.1